MIRFDDMGFGEYMGEYEEAYGGYQYRYMRELRKGGVKVRKSICKKGRWKDEEKERFAEGYREYSKHKCRFKEISRVVGSRTREQCKSYWNTQKKKGEKEKEKEKEGRQWRAGPQVDQVDEVYEVDEVDQINPPDSPFPVFDDLSSSEVKGLEMEVGDSGELGNIGELGETGDMYRNSCSPLADAQSTAYSFQGIPPEQEITDYGAAEFALLWPDFKLS